MPDTGAPWNIPYVAGTDLVSDWPTDSQALATAIANGLDAAGNAGIGSNVVQTVKTDVFTTTSNSYVDITNFSATITPSSNTSKILVVAYFSYSNTASLASFNAGVHVQLVRTSTAIFIGDAAGSRTSSSASEGQASSAGAGQASIVYLDSPTTTSATTYKLQMRIGNGGTAVFNRFGDDSDAASRGRTASSLTVIEVAA